MDIKKLGWITVGLVIALAILTYASFAPQEVTLSSKKWACVHARPAGIGAECVEYQLKDLGR